MAKKTAKTTQKSNQSFDQKSSRISTARKPAGRAGDAADAATIERLEAIAGGADEDDPRLFLDPGLSREVFKLDASTDEEVDALRVGLVQDGGASRTRDTSGRVVDDTAEEELARFTEVGPMQADRGAVSVEPGRDDTSRVLRRHQAKKGVARAQELVEGNLEGLGTRD